MRIGFLFSTKVIDLFSHMLRNIINYKDLFIIVPENFNYNNNIDYFKFNNIEENNIIYYSKDKIIEIINSFDFIIITEYVDLKYYIDINYLYKINKDLKIYFIMHGITQIFYNNKEIHSDFDNKVKKIFKDWINNVNTNNLKIILCCKNLYEILNEYCSKDNLIKLNSLPQFKLNDIIFNQKNNFKYINDIIIFPTVLKDINKDNKLNNLIKIIRDNYPDKKIVIKLKSKMKSLLNEIKSLNDDNILIDFGIYHTSYYFKSFLNIILDGGTTFFESLLYNKKTLMHKINLDNFYYQNYPIEFNKLLISYDLNTFTDNLDKINNETYFDEEYNKDIKKLIKFHIGVEEISNFEEDFKENIIYPYLVEKNNNLKKIYNELINKQ